jgi:hypothetical protein
MQLGKCFADKASQLSLGKTRRLAQPVKGLHKGGFMQQNKAQQNFVALYFVADLDFNSEL